MALVRCFGGGLLEFVLVLRWWMLTSAPPISEAISLAIATVVCFSVSARIFRPMPDDCIGDWEREWCRDLYAGAGALFAMTLAWLELPPQFVALVWTVPGAV